MHATPGVVVNLRDVLNAAHDVLCMTGTPPTGALLRAKLGALTDIEVSWLAVKLEKLQTAHAALLRELRRA